MKKKENKRSVSAAVVLTSLIRRTWRSPLQDINHRQSTDPHGSSRHGSSRACGAPRPWLHWTLNDVRFSRHCRRCNPLPYARSENVLSRFASDHQTWSSFQIVCDRRSTTSRTTTMATLSPWQRSSHARRIHRRVGNYVCEFGGPISHRIDHHSSNIPFLRRPSGLTQWSLHGHPYAIVAQGR